MTKPAHELSRKDSIMRLLMLKMLEQSSSLDINASHLDFGLHFDLRDGISDLILRFVASYL
jgi:hypothetical protein